MTAVHVPVDIDANLPHGMWRILILYLADGKCQDCGKDYQLECHHINEDRTDNR